MEKLLQWAIINSATEKEDAPPRDSTQTVAPKQLDPAIIDHILGKDDSVLMKEAMAAALDPRADPETKEVALTDLELLVSQIDNANNLVPLRLWDPLLGLLDSPEPALRRDAVWVCGTSVQNNPKAQQAFLDRKGLDKALALVASDPDEAVRDKAMYCVSAAVRQFPPGLKYFFEQRGLPVIKTALTTSENPRLLRRIYFLLATLVQVEDYQPVISDRFVDEGLLDLVADRCPQYYGNDRLDILDHALGFLVGLHHPATTYRLKDTLAKYPALATTVGQLAASSQQDALTPEVWDKLETALS